MPSTAHKCTAHCHRVLPCADLAAAARVGKGHSSDVNCTRKCVGEAINRNVGGPFRFSSLKRFAFDLSKDEVDQTIKLLQASSSSLQRSSVITVRNGVIHPKQKFPTQTEIDKCCETLGATIRALEQAGLIPTISATVKVQDDAFRRQEATSVNYGDRYLKWSPSPALQVIKTLPSGA